jgi:hypothetical protein
VRPASLFLQTPQLQFHSLTAHRLRFAPSASMLPLLAGGIRQKARGLKIRNCRNVPVRNFLSPLSVIHITERFAQSSIGFHSTATLVCDSLSALCLQPESEGQHNPSPGRHDLPKQDTSVRLSSPGSRTGSGQPFQLAVRASTDFAKH